MPRRSCSPTSPRVMVTGLDDREIANAALELGAYGYIIKPFQSNEILISVTNALRRRALEIDNSRTPDASRANGKGADGRVVERYPRLGDDPGEPPQVARGDRQATGDCGRVP